ncbi:MAG: hypothetical protein U0572_03645 [Phycisphaerales bacterium]
MNNRADRSPRQLDPIGSVVRTMAGWRSLSALIAIATSASFAIAAPTDTAWLAPVDGNFADPARWTDGAPNSTSVAIFGASDSTDPFSVTFATSPSIAMLRVLSQSPLFALGGHSLALLSAEGLTIAGPESLAPTHTISNGTLTTPKATIGATGAGGGTLRVRDGAHFVSSSTSFGLTAPDLGLLDVRGPGTTASIGPLPSAGIRTSIGDGAMVSMTTSSFDPSLSTQSSLHFEIGSNGAGMLQVAGPIILHGAFSLTFADGFVPAPGSSFLLVSSTNASVQFESIDVPSFNGVPVLIVASGAYVFAAIPDASTHLVISPAQLEVSSGFWATAPASAWLVYANNQMVNVTGSALWSTADPSVATVLPWGWVHGESVGNTTISASWGWLVGTASVSTNPVPAALQIIRASEASDGTGGDGDVDYFDEVSALAISSDGRYVAFSSGASNLVSGDSNGYKDVFRKDLWTGAIDRVSVALDGGPANGNSAQPAMSADGQIIAFRSTASNLVAGDDTTSDVFVRDLSLGTTERIRAVPPAGDLFVKALGPRLTPDGRFLAIIQADWNASLGTQYRAYRFDRLSQTSELASVTDGGMPAAVLQTYPLDISDDGAVVTFTSFRLLPSEPPSSIQQWIRDLSSGALICVSCAADGTFGNGTSRFGRLSAEGRLVAFLSSATNLVPNSNDGFNDVLVWDRTTRAFERANVSSTGEEANEFAYSPALSSDGRFVLFASSAPNLANGAANGARHLYRHDRITETTTMVSLGPVGPGDGHSHYGCDGADSGAIAWASNSSNLSGFDLNGHRDVFVRAMPPSVFADLDGDGIVNAADLAILIAAWGSNSYFPDLDKDGVVGAADLGSLLGAWSIR